MGMIPKGRYCKVVCKETKEIIAYLDRERNDTILTDDADRFMHKVYDLWTAPDGEAETYGIAFGSFFVCHASDIAVGMISNNGDIKLVESDLPF